MTTKKDAWIAAYCAGLQTWMPMEHVSLNKTYAGCVAQADRAAADFEASFPEQPEPDDFIKIPRKDANGLILPDWVKSGAKCIFEGYVRIIDFIGQDKRGIWCCRLGFDGDPDKGQWAFVSNIKPKNG